MKNKQKFLTALALVSLSIANAQFGVNTTTPKSTLEVMGTPAGVTIPDGIIAPRLTGDQLAAKNAVYTADQTGAQVYVTAAATTPAGKTINVTAPGYYYFDGVVWKGFGSASGLNVSTLQTGNYTASATDVVIQSNITAPGFTITLPTTGIPVGKIYYISNKGTQNWIISPLPTTTTVQWIEAGGGHSLIWTGTEYIGVTGY